MLKNKLIFALGIFILLSSTPFNIAASPMQEKAIVQSPAGKQFAENEENTAKYLKYYFDIEFLDSITVADFLSACDKVSGQKTNSSDSTFVSFNDAVAHSLKYAGFSELAMTYDKRTAQESLKKHSVSLTLSDVNSQNISCALDIGLIGADHAIASGNNSFVSVNVANRMILFIASVNGKARNFLGKSDEADIYSKIYHAYQAGMVFSNTDLFDLGAKAVQNKVSTGFSLKKNNFNANFLPELTLVYGHSSLKHINQLLSLLEREGITAKVQLEPKFSIFEYLLEWGPLPEPSAGYFVEEAADNFYLAHSYEYDLSLEFNNINDKERFDGVIRAYAKKNTDNPPDKALLASSWWQPLYYSGNKVNTDYGPAYNNMITDGVYYINSFCLPGEMEKARDAFTSLNIQEFSKHGFNQSVQEIYCNNAFIRYLNGESE